MRYKRNTALDFNRGMLLIIMILLHCIDDFAPLSYFAKSIRFVSGAFIFVAGFVITNIYLGKYEIRESGIYKRLFYRGVKLLLVFTFAGTIMEPDNFMTFVISFAVTAITMFLLIELTDVARKKIAVFDRLYKFIFA